MRFEKKVDFPKKIKENIFHLHQNGIYLELDEDIFNSFKLYDDVKEKLEPYKEFIGEQFIELDEFIDDFKNKMSREITDNKTLKIVFGGQQKSGISSFLNALIFGNNEIFDNLKEDINLVPYKICYSKTKKVDIEFFSKEDWEEILKKNEKVLKEDKFDEVIIRNIYKKSVYIDQSKYLDKTITIYRDCNNQDFINKLNDYININGEYASMVKNVTIYTDNDDLKGVEILELLGTKDPIINRDKKTKEFISKSDVLFFFSIAGKFMDDTDLNYLRENILNKGAKNIVFVGSKFDNVLLKRKEEFKGNINKHLDDTVNDLKKQAIKSLNKLDINNMRYKLYNFENSSKKIEFISTVSHDIANNHYVMSQLGKDIFKDLSSNFNNINCNRSFFKKLSNVENIKRKYFIEGKKEKTKRLKLKWENVLKKSDDYFKNRLENIKLDCTSKIDFCESQKLMEEEKYTKVYKEVANIVDKSIKQLV